MDQEDHLMDHLVLLVLVEEVMGRSQVHQVLQRKVRV
jgi:hypothetical protein